MKSKYFLLWVEDVTYKAKDGSMKPSFNHYLLDGDGKVTIRNAQERKADLIDMQVVANFAPRVEATVDEVKYTNKETGRPSSFIALSKIDIL